MSAVPHVVFPTYITGMRVFCLAVSCALPSDQFADRELFYTLQKRCLLPQSHHRGKEKGPGFRR